MSRGGPGFRRLRRGSSEAWVDPRFESAADAAGLLDADAVLARFSGARGADGRGPIARAHLADGTALVMRRILHGGLLAPFLGDALAGMGRPHRELETTAALIRSGAPVPTPVLAVGRRRFGPLWQAALATIEVPDTRSARDFLAGAPSSEALVSAAAAAGRAVRSFHEAGGRHPDLHLGNLLVRNHGGAFDVWVIDLDKATCASPPNASRRMTELGRLYRSAVKRGVAQLLDAGGTRAFFDAYTDHDEPLRAALLTHRPREARRLRYHRLHYHRRKTA